MQGLARGPVVFGMFYTNFAGGHALTATELHLDDRNANGRIEYGEGILSFIDPLDPAQAYEPKVEDNIEVDQFKNLESVGPPKIKKGLIWQDEAGFLRFYYNQESLDISKDKLTILGGDSSNGTTNQNGSIEDKSPNPVYANITLAMAINTSGLAPDFDQRVGTLSDTPGLLDFSFLLDDPSSQSQNLAGYVYSNESSAYSNDFWYYECINPEGLIEFVDPLTGQKSQLKPGDDGYNEIALDLVQDFSNGGAATLGIRQSNDSETLTPFNLKLSELKTGYLAPISLTSKGDIWSPFADANSDGLDHYRSTGPLSWRMEDLKGLGDKDFNDLHISVLIQSISSDSATL